MNTIPVLYVEDNYHFSALVNMWPGWQVHA